MSLPQSDTVSQASSRILNSEEVTHSQTITYEEVYQNLQTLLSQFSALVKASHEMSSSTGKSFVAATDACLSIDNQRLLKDNSQDMLDIDDDDIFRETLSPNQRLNKDIDQVQQERCANDVHDEDHYVNQVDQTCAFVPMPRKPVVPTSSASLPAATSAAESIMFPSTTSPASVPTPTSSATTAVSATKPIVSSPTTAATSAEEPIAFSPVSALQQTQTATS